MLLFHLISSVVWWLSLLLFQLLFFFVCISVVDFCFAVTMRFWYSTLYIYMIVLSCWSLSFKCVPIILHLYSLLTTAGFDIIVVCRWFPTLTVYLPLSVSKITVSIWKFLVSSYAFLFCFEKHLLKSCSGGAEFLSFCLSVKFLISLWSLNESCWVEYSSL